MHIAVPIIIAIVVSVAIIAIIIVLFTPTSFIQKLQNKSWSIQDFPSKKVNFQIDESQKKITVIGLEDAFDEKTFTYNLLDNKLVSTFSKKMGDITGNVTFEIKLQNNNNLLLVYTFTYNESEKNKGESQFSIQLI